MIYQALWNGVKIPVLGLGTFKLEPNETYKIVVEALRMGYRHIDTAAYYGNETEVGQAIRDSGIPREEIFVTTKLWKDQVGYDAALVAFNQSLERLGLDYIDLYLLHWPIPESRQSWRALEDIYESGRVKAIGVSNFDNTQMAALIKGMKVLPMVNQIERHPLRVREDVRKFDMDLEMVMEGWRPIVRGDLENDPQLMALAFKYNKTVAQVILRWHIQTDFVVFPKTSNVERLLENISIFDFELTEDEIHLISAMDQEKASLEPQVSVNPKL
ncbi:aldo/keto reductase [Erysipelothrix sp. HDW6C]|uniref:aldo/keto reductase n=1 Tax=Erysipelothrix sp. HDW6C TaxID=2714930 RepID=UPI00140BF3DC|nr:aldo/keto reductase [Erysipelothrix sp. HDW6C]QIK69231.1 aldo/keto reductase [Erysipelothrix sp. HDW6C]